MFEALLKVIMIMGSEYRFAIRVAQRIKSKVGIQNSFLVLLILTNFLIYSGLELGATPVSPDQKSDSFPSIDNKINLHTYSIGDEESFSVWDFFEEVRKPVTGTCRAIGDEAYIFLDNQIPLNQNYSIISELVDTYMIPILTTNFASPPDHDNNDRVVILYTILNGAGGYFSRNDPYGGEIVYINGEMGSLRIDTVIHELQHLVNYGYDAQETIWFNEGCSMFSEFLLDYAEGYTDAHQLYYPHDVSLLFWDYDNAGLDTDYKAALAFIAYLQDQFGSQNLSDIYHAESGGDKLQSSTAIMHILNQYYPELSFEELYMDFILATILDNKYEGNKRELYFAEYVSLPSPLRFPAGGVISQDYPYDSTWEILPWSTKNYLFRNFPDPEEINISVTIPEDSQDHLFGVNLIKENRSLNYTDSSYQSYLLTAENISAGIHLTLNATAEEIDQFYLTISHLDGGEGGYYDDIPSSERNVEVSLKVTTGDGESSTNTDTTSTDGTETTPAVSFSYVIIFGLGLAFLRKRKLR
ncbi:hypothetical protein CEE45_14365 [Candidatus Heimdallarchaeota archaeon B3_Heim]|nr:MAG: hypothetical protein CEE45_14365 [Candidatus Heimdallarchaeota archaeon B3_Heim]